MTDLPDNTARRDELERWMAERIDNQQAPVRLRVRLRFELAKAGLTVAAKRDRLVDRILDRELGTAGTDNRPEHDHPDRVRYVPSSWHVLPRALRYLGVSDEDTFVDFGCGKGRILHQAAKRPFRRVVGVEISPELAEIARSGLAARRHQYRCRNVEIVVADATDFPVPDDFTIGYFYDPFRDETLEGVLRSIVDSIDRRPRCVRLIYVNPWQESRILATGRFRLLKKQRSRLLDSPSSEAAIFESL
jgi:SAM-dependent methyltransferase